jgi:hypothetical protein
MGTAGCEMIGSEAVAGEDSEFMKLAKATTLSMKA